MLAVPTRTPCALGPRPRPRPRPRFSGLRPGESTTSYPGPGRRPGIGPGLVSGFQTGGIRTPTLTATRDRNADPDSDRDRPRSGPDRVSVRPRLGLGPSRIHGVRVSRCSAGPDPTQPDPRTTQSSRRRADAGCADCYSLHIDAVLAYCGVVNCTATFAPRRYISAPLECYN